MPMRLSSMALPFGCSHVSMMNRGDDLARVPL